MTTPVVIDASAGVEMVARTAHGAALRRLLPADAEGWVPEHFYAEALGVLRRQLIVERKITNEQAQQAVARLDAWPLNRSMLRPLIVNAWAYRNNITAPDAFYVELAARLGGLLLTADNKLANSPVLPVSVLYIAPAL